MSIEALMRGGPLDGQVYSVQSMNDNVFVTSDKPGLLCEYIGTDHGFFVFAGYVRKKDVDDYNKRKPPEGGIV